jgi:hypothetical protein
MSNIQVPPLVNYMSNTAHVFGREIDEITEHTDGERESSTYIHN